MNTDFLAFFRRISLISAIHSQVWFSCSAAEPSNNLFILCPNRGIPSIGYPEDLSYKGVASFTLICASEHFFNFNFFFIWYINIFFHWIVLEEKYLSKYLKCWHIRSYFSFGNAWYPCKYQPENIYSLRKNISYCGKTSLYTQFITERIAQSAEAVEYTDCFSAEE